MSWTSSIAGAVGAFMLIAVAHASGGAAPAASPSSTPPPPGPGLDLINERCSFCHTSASIFVRHKTRADWAATVQAMADRGADVSPEEMKTIVDYLAANYAPADTGKAAAGGGKQ